MSRKLKSIQVELTVAPVHRLIFLLVMTAVMVLIKQKKVCE